MVVRDLGERVKTILGENDLASRLHQKNLSASTDSIAIVDHHDAYAGQAIAFSHANLDDQLSSFHATSGDLFPGKVFARFLSMGAPESPPTGLAAQDQNETPQRRVANGVPATGQNLLTSFRLSFLTFQNKQEA
jgi:hypothetical protein